eukprot:5348752-Pleurochrysis_carterae.AAC.3
MNATAITACLERTQRRVATPSFCRSFATVLLVASIGEQDVSATAPPVWLFPPGDVTRASCGFNELADLRVCRATFPCSILGCCMAVERTRVRDAGCASSRCAAARQSTLCACSAFSNAMHPM